MTTLILLYLLAGPADSSISILAWNVESGGSDPAVIARQLGEFADQDIIALSEVPSRSFDVFCEGAGAKFSMVNSATGRADRLQILYDHTGLNSFVSRNSMSIEDTSSTTERTVHHS